MSKLAILEVNSTGIGIKLPVDIVYCVRSRPKSEFLSSWLTFWHIWSQD